MILRGDVFSQTLDMNTGVTVVGPFDFSSDEPYSVCYVLHGLCGNSSDWANFTLLPLYAREYRTVFILPEVSRSFYSDMRHGQKFFSYIVDELPQICGAVFNISSLPADTVILGASMGGYGALKCALSRPERYGRCCAISSACLFMREDLEMLKKPGGEERAMEIFGEQLPVDFKAIFGDSLEWTPEADIIELAHNASALAKKPRLYLACGDEDYLVTSNRRFHDELEKLCFDFLYEEWQGEHSWDFFNAALHKALAWCYGGTR